MTDREKVIGHLNDCVEASKSDNTWVFVRKDIVEDALVLLKEQDAVEPKFVMNEWRCGACGHVVLTYSFDTNEGKMGKVMANYCPSCGRSVKWE